MKKHVLAAAALIALYIIAFYFFSNYNSVKIRNSQDAIETVFAFDYQMLEARGKNIPMFAGPDNYILEFNRPRIPLYSRTIELPENASLERVEMKSSELKTYENVDVEFTPSDEHFVPANDSLEGFYPEQVLWHNIFETLDGRKKIELIAAPMQYNSQTRQAKIYSSMKIAVYYKM